MSSPPPQDERKKKSVCLCTSRNAIHRKLWPKCEFPAFCEAVHVAASNGRQHCLKKIMCFFPMVFIVKRQWTILSETQKMCSERGQWLDLPRQSALFFSLFSIFSIVSHRKSFKWHLTLLFAADRPTAAKFCNFLSMHEHTCVADIFLFCSLLFLNDYVHWNSFLFLGTHFCDKIFKTQGSLASFFVAL